MLAAAEGSRETCLFCQISGSPELDLPWYDRPLLREPGVGAAICAVGSFVPGYILVAPAQHHNSVWGMPRDLAEGFLVFVRRALQMIEDTYGPATAFEHGSCRDTERRRSACITHSHIHIVPGSYSLSLLKLDVGFVGSLSRIEEIPASLRNDGYLMYRESGQSAHYARDVGVSQFFRRHIAKVIGRPNEWDYAVYPQWENIEQTQKRLRGYSSRTQTRKPQLLSDGREHA